MQPKAPGSARYRSAQYADTVSRIASNVRRIRAAHPWTQEEVAARAGRLSPRLYRQIESGTTNLTAATLTRIAEALEVDVAALLAPAPPPQPKRGRPRKNPHDEGRASITSNPVDEASRSAEAVLSKVSSEAQAEGPARADRPGTLPSPLGPSTAAVPQARGADANPAGDAPEASPLADRVAEFRRELEDRLSRLVREAQQVESALLNLADAPGGAPSTTTAVVARVTAAAVITLPLQDERSVRGAVVLLLRANPGGLRTTELAEALRVSHLRPRKNELHNVVRSLFDAGVLARDGFRGGYVYRLRTGGREPPAS